LCPARLPMMTTRLCELLSCKKLIDWLIDYLVLSDACLLPKESGSCFNQDLRFYWDAEVAECRPLMYSGCGGNGNNFATQDDCYAACGRAVTTPDGARRRYRRRRYRPGDCYEAVSAGTTCDADRDGDGVTPRWYFDSEHGNCLAFYFNGCNGNGNNFHSYDDCIALCFKGFMLACVKPSTHWRQKSNVEATFDKNQYLRQSGDKGNCRRYVRLCRRFVAGAGDCRLSTKRQQLEYL